MFELDSLLVLISHAWKAAFAHIFSSAMTNSKILFDAHLILSLCVFVSLFRRCVSISEAGDVSVFSFLDAYYFHFIAIYFLGPSPYKS